MILVFVTAVITALVPTLTSTQSLKPADLANIHLVTTTQLSPSINSSLLTNVSATSLFDPFNQEAYSSASSHQATIRYQPSTLRTARYTS